MNIGRRQGAGERAALVAGGGGAVADDFLRIAPVEAPRPPALAAQAPTITVTTDQISDFVVSGDGLRVYTVNSFNGLIKVYQAETGTFITSWDAGQILAQADLSLDGRTLIATGYQFRGSTPQGPIVATYKLDVETGIITEFLYQAQNGGSTFGDAAFLDNGMVLLAQGGSPSLVTLLNPATGQYSPLAVPSAGELTRSLDGNRLLMGAGNGLPAGVYDAEEGFVVRAGDFGLKQGVQAYSPEANLIVGHEHGGGLHVYNGNLQFQMQLTQFNPDWATGIAGLAFDETGAFLFVLDSDDDAIHQVRTSNWTIVQSIPLGVPINLSGTAATELVVGPDMRFFMVMRSFGVMKVDNPLLAEAIVGTLGPDMLAGTAGNDTIIGDSDADSMTGGAGDDVYYLDHAGDVVTEAAGGGTDTIRTSISYTLGAGHEIERLETTNRHGNGLINLFGNELGQQITGNSAANFLAGGDGADTLNGGGGHDTLVGGLGADALNGDAGIDTASYADIAGAVSVNLTLGQGFGNHAQGDTFSGVENVLGSGLGDSIIGEAGANRLDGADGDDILIGSLGADLLVGGNGSDTASYEENWGGAFANLNTGQGFGNAAQGDSYSGIEHLKGSIFADFFIGDSGDNRLDGGDGTDTLIGSLGADVLVGGNGTDTASYEENWGGVFVNLDSGQGFGNAAQGDTYSSIENLKGGIFADFFIGTLGVNTLEGADGDDTLVGSLGADVLIGGNGSDTASYEENWGGVFANLNTGMGFGNAAQGDTYSGIENLRGGIYDDTLLGDGGANRLDGNGGSDTLAGGLGADTLTGAAGVDTFRFDTALGGGNIDAITDFATGSDKIVLDDSVFTTLGLGALAAGAFVTGTAAADADDRIVYDSATGALFYDADGSGALAAVQFAALSGAPALAAGDFMVI